MFRMRINSIREHAKFEPEYSYLEESASQWYFSREEIENSPSRKDGIDLRREIYLQRSYSTFLQDLGMRIGIPQMTIATAITLCHRFFHRQSHAKNDRTVIAIACMLLSGKAEDTPVPVSEVVLKSYEILSRKNPLLKEKKTRKDFFQEQRQIILNAEILVLTTLGFDVAVYHPYRQLRTAIKNFGIAEDDPLIQVAWNFVNDGLRTSLWLQFKPREIAAGAIFLAAKFRRVKLPKAWWETFNVSPKRLEEFSNQLVELYEEMNRIAFGGNQPGKSGEGTQVTGKDDKYPPKDAKGKSCANQLNDYGTMISNESVFNTLQLSANRMKSLERLESKIQCGRPKDMIRSRSPSKLLEASDQKASTSTQVDELDMSSLQDRQADKIDKPEAEFETKGGIQFDNNKQLSSVDISSVDAEKIAQLKRRKLLRKGRNSTPDISETKVRDEEDLIESELERGVEEAAKAEKEKQERNNYRSDSCYKPRKESAQYRKECARKDGSTLNGKRFNEDTISDKITKCTTNEADLCHQGQEMLPSDDPNGEREEGEIPNSPVEELTKPSNEGPSQVSNQPETGNDSVRGSDWCGPKPYKTKDDSERSRDHQGIRHGSYDRKVSRSHHHPYHSSDHQGRDCGRERKRYRDKNWEEQRDHARYSKMPTDRNWEDNISKRRRRDDRK